MKKSTLLFFSCFLLWGMQVQAQLRIGIRAGVSTTDLHPSELQIFDTGGAQRLNLALKDARYGVFAGVVIRAQIHKFILQPEVIFNSNRVDYAVQDLQDSSLTSLIKSEKYQYLDIPVLLGVKFGPLRLQAGPVGHVYINSSSELTDIEGYDEKFDQFTFGWQGGLGLDIWKFMIDVRYEGNFNKFGDHIEFFGHQYAFDQKPARFLFSLGFLFGSQD